MIHVKSSEHHECAERLTLSGSVQGIGFRPAIARLACELELTGTVRNAMHGVVIELEGNADAMDAFRERFKESFPHLARIGEIVREATEFTGCAQFSIIQSDPMGPPGTAVPPDLRICDQCLLDLRDSTNRRFGYAFTNCTDCGPRYSILNSMPYDRERSGMKPFTMCDACRREYLSPKDRRFHSQLNCCSACGPNIWFSKSRCSASPDAALSLAAELILSGGILGLKGLGGYHLVCDATNGEAVRKLRRRKRRLTKPFAIMVDRLVQVDAWASLSLCEQQSIQSPAGPIVLLEAREGSVLAHSIHPGLKTLGVMLPTTALHALLLDRCLIPLVVTSGNVEGEPLVYRFEDAESRLSAIADAFLHHDREIVHPVDDSVVRCMNGRIVTLRAARGLTPLSVKLHSERAILAVGGHQKTSIALSNGRQAVLGPHIGDLASVASRERFVEQVARMRGLYLSNPEEIAHDMHPDYFSTRWASTMNKRCLAVQHHHAHIVSGMLEHGWLDQTVLGIAFDGTGWGPNGLIHGGEILLASGTEYEHIGSLRPFRLLGGEAAIHEPQRVAIALLADALELDFDTVCDLLRFRAQNASFHTNLTAPLQSLVAEFPRIQGDSSLNSCEFSYTWRCSIKSLAQSRFSPLTTSAGRLFDGVAALVWGDFRPSYEGELAMRWEAICDPQEKDVYPLAVDPTSGMIDWRPMVRALYSDFKSGVSCGAMAMRFHRGLAMAIFDFCESYPNYRVILSGGVFQNRVLVELLEPLFAAKARTVGWPGSIPPNDGGLAVGQLALAVAMERELNRTVSTCV